MFTTIMAIITANWGLSLAAGTGISTLISFFMPKIFGWKIVQQALGWFLQSAAWAALPFAKWLKLGPLKHIVVVPLLLLQILNAWFMRFNDKVLSELDESSRTMSRGIAEALARVGSIDQQHYYKVKGMTAEQVNLITSMADAVTTTRELVPEDQAVLDRALSAGKALLEARIK